jgi:hypothetical protein
MIVVSNPSNTTYWILKINDIYVNGITEINQTTETTDIAIIEYLGEDYTEYSNKLIEFGLVTPEIAPEIVPEVVPDFSPEIIIETPNETN